MLIQLLFEIEPSRLRKRNSRILSPLGLSTAVLGPAEATEPKPVSDVAASVIDTLPISVESQLAPKITQTSDRKPPMPRLESRAFPMGKHDFFESINNTSIVSTSDLFLSSDDVDYSKTALVRRFVHDGIISAPRGSDADAFVPRNRPDWTKRSMEEGKSKPKNPSNQQNNVAFGLLQSKVMETFLPPASRKKNMALLNPILMHELQQKRLHPDFRHNKGSDRLPDGYFVNTLFVVSSDYVMNSGISSKQLHRGIPRLNIQKSNPQNGMLNVSPAIFYDRLDTAVGTGTTPNKAGGLFAAPDFFIEKGPDDSVSDFHL